MNKTQNVVTERKVEQVAVAQMNLAGLQEMGPTELAAVEGGYGTPPTGFPVFVSSHGGILISSTGGGIVA
jgi:hypothetical protein